jgi:D-glycero-alpha-D-manno-heptose 1-phosphate guanylyltransferase
MPLKEAIILAGGLGTRLRSAVPDLPKCMAPVKNKPFITYVIDYLLQQGIEKFILSLGYKSEVIIDFVKTQYPDITIQYSIEAEPLGTGGAIQLACNKATEKDVLVTNGDTLFKANLKTLANVHHQLNALCTLCLKPMQNFNRYGVVELNEESQILSFKEKQFYQEGLINGGLYALNIASFLQKKLPGKFSFENNFLEKYYVDGILYGCIQNEYFIDIGIPEDYNRAQTEL